MKIDLIEVLKNIEDDRDPQGREYKLWEVLFVSILALLSNSKTYTDICVFAQEHLDSLKTHFGFKWKRVPTPSALRKIIVRQNPADIEKAFRLISKPCDKKVNETGLMKQICVDGKTLNGSFSHAKDQRGARVFSAFSCFEDIVLAHIPLSSDKEHEITALQELLESLDIKGCIVSADAIHCQKKLLI
ncbi:MAG: hypothetical protein FADNKDHG_01536 [Holosporales bacterium]